jgi:hypothetical protein
MIKIVFSLALIFLIVYALYCWVATLATHSMEKQVTYLETFFKGLKALTVCFTITAVIVFFIVIIF